MGQAIALRPDFTATELRRLATRTKDVAQARWRLQRSWMAPRARKRRGSAGWTGRRCGTG